MENFDDAVLFNLKMLRVIAEAKVRTLEKYGDSDNLARAQIVEKILANDNCFTEMTLEEAVEVLTALGFKHEYAQLQAKNLCSQSQCATKKLRHLKK